MKPRWPLAPGPGQMSESDTTILRRARDGIGKHANSAYNGLSAAAIVFLYATFPSKEDVDRHIDKLNAAQSKQWQQLMDNHVEIELLKRRFSSLDATNATELASQP